MQKDIKFPKERTDKNIEKYWTDMAKEVLLGKKIVGVRYMTNREAESFGWDSRGIVFFLEDNTFVFTQADDEGNRAGVLSYSSLNDENPYTDSVMPVI